MIRLLIDGYLPYLIAFCWMVAASRLPLRRLVQNAIVGLFLLLLLTSHRDPRTGLLVMPRGWMAALILVGLAVLFFRDMLGRMGYRGHL
jgi:hypothetical protein